MWAKFESLSFILGVLDSLKDGEHSKLEGNGLIRKPGLRTVVGTSRHSVNIFEYSYSLESNFSD